MRGLREGMSLAVMAAAALVSEPPRQFELKRSPWDDAFERPSVASRPRFISVKRPADPAKKAKRKAQKRARLIMRKAQP